MGLDDVTGVHLVGAHSAVVRSLRAGEAVLGPAEGAAVHVQQGVLLLDAEPGRGVLGGLHGGGAGGAPVGVGGLAVVLERLAQHQLVVAAAEGVAVHGDGLQVRVRVAALGLVGGAAVIVPLGQL